MISPLPDALMVPSDVLNTPNVLVIFPQCTEHPPMLVMNTPDVLNIPRCTESPPTHIIEGDFMFVSSPQMEIF